MYRFYIGRGIIYDKIFYYASSGGSRQFGFTDALGMIFRNSKIKNKTLFNDFKVGGDKLIFRPEFKFYGSVATDI
jgi:hypothetical protein